MASREEVSHCQHSCIFLHSCNDGVSQRCDTYQDNITRTHVFIIQTMLSLRSNTFKVARGISPKTLEIVLLSNFF